MNFYHQREEPLKAQHAKHSGTFRLNGLVIVEHMVF